MHQVIELDENTHQVARILFQVAPHAPSASALCERELPTYANSGDINSWEKGEETNDASAESETGTALLQHATRDRVRPYDVDHGHRGAKCRV